MIRNDSTKTLSQHTYSFILSEVMHLYRMSVGKYCYKWNKELTIRCTIWYMDCLHKIQQKRLHTTTKYKKNWSATEITRNASIFSFNNDIICSTNLHFSSFYCSKVYKIHFRKFSFNVLYSFLAFLGPSPAHWDIFSSEVLIRFANVP